MDIKSEVVFQDLFAMNMDKSFVPFTQSDPAMANFQGYTYEPCPMDQRSPCMASPMSQPQPVHSSMSSRVRKAPARPPRSPLGSPNSPAPTTPTRPVPKKTSFICKLESMLENEPQFFSWSANGKAVVIRGLHCENFGNMLAKYRSSPKPATFLRNLNTYNFKKIPSTTAGSLAQQGTSLADQYEVYANAAFTRDFKDIAVLHSAVYRDSRKEGQKRSASRKTQQLAESKKDAEIERLKSRVAELESELEHERSAAKRSRRGSSALDSDSWSEADSGCGAAAAAVVRSTNVTDFEKEALEIAGPSQALLADIDMEKIVSEWMTCTQ